jgi:hypothetical protein
MAGHTSEKRWVSARNGTQIFEGISERAQIVLKDFIEKLILAEEAYQQMQEIYIYSGGSATDLANLLFAEDIAARSESVANADEIAKATDLAAAMSAAHEVYQAANNISVTQEDRLGLIRRMV